MLNYDEIPWNAMDRHNPIYSDASVRAWPAPLRESLLTLKILREAELSTHVKCPSCRHRHEEPVIAFPRENGKTQFFIYCPEELRVELSPSDLRQWTIDMGQMAHHLAASLGVSGRCTPLESSRLWRLGRIVWQGASRDVLLARGLTWDDGTSVARQIVRTTRPIVFVGARIPAPDIWPGRIPPVVALSQVATVGGSQLELDRDAVVAMVREADDAAARPPEILTVQQLKVIVRQQVNAEEKSALFDDACLAAYRSEGSYRKAALLLSQELGRAVSKDQIAQAMKRRGGLAAVLRSGPQSEAKSVRGKSG